MADLVILYWRDIPSQVIARSGRTTAKAELPKRFLEAIDAAAMRAGATGTDAYLESWRRGEPIRCGDNLEQAVADATAAIEATYGTDRLRRLIEGGGHEGET